MSLTDIFVTDLLALPQHPVNKRSQQRFKRQPQRPVTQGNDLNLWDEDSKHLVHVEFTDDAVALIERHHPYLQDIATAYDKEHGGQTSVQEVLLTEIARIQLELQEQGKPSPWIVEDPSLISTGGVYPHVGRNEPCPCGSGKKYKRCHGKQ